MLSARITSPGADNAMRI